LSSIQRGGRIWQVGDGQTGLVRPTILVYAPQATHQREKWLPKEGSGRSMETPADAGPG
jgi:hypothetical protein